MTKILCGLAALFCLSALHAQHLLTPSDMYKARNIGAPVLSPDGKWVLYTVNVLDSAKDKGNSDLWMTNWESKETIRLTSSPDGESDPQWSPDGKYISFIAAREGGKSQVWLLDRRGGEASRLTDEKDGIDGYLWSPDSKRLLLTKRDPADTSAAGKRKPYVIDRYKFKQDVQGYKYDARSTHLYLFDVASKKTDTLTSGIYSELDPEWSPDGTKIVFVSNRTADPDRNMNSDLWIIDAFKGSPIVQLTAWPGGDNSPTWSPDSRWIAYTRTMSDAAAEFYNQEVLCVIPVTGGEPLLLSKDLDRPVSNVEWTKDGKSVGCLVQDDARRYIVSYDVKKGTMKKVLAGDRSFSVLKAHSADNWLTVSASAGQPPEVYAVRKGMLDPLTSIQKPFTDSLIVADVETFSSTSSDGTRVTGLIYFPPNRPRTHLPLIMNIHGGPVSQNELSFDMTSQVLAAHGYAVATVNYRGSSGRGLDYSHTITGDWGNKEVLDILGANDYLVKAGIADSSRMGIFGWSYGGILTDYVIATTTRFKAASSGAGMGAPLSLYGVDQYILQYDNEIGSPWKEGSLEKYVKMSYPLLHADRIHTPTMFMGGDRDFNVPISGGEQMYQALRSLNVPSELVVYPNQFHGFSQPSFIRDRYQRYLDWFDKYLGKP